MGTLCVCLSGGTKKLIQADGGIGLWDWLAGGDIIIIQPDAG